VLFRLEDGGVPSDPSVHYFVDEFPNRTQAETSDDGLWLILNAPPGAGAVEMYTWNGGGHTLQGRANVVVQAGGFLTVDTFTGSYTGVMVPDECADCP
jgi:hypothetical protein